MDSFKHLTDADRLEIEQGLRQGLRIRQIAIKIGKHPATVKREIEARRIVSNKGAAGRITNRCALRRECTVIQLCEHRPDCVRRCATCHLCNAQCKKFKEEVCEKLNRPPRVCNGCQSEHACVLKKRFYLHNTAHKNYRQILETSREGANISEQELLGLDALVSPLVAKGQSVHHILANNKNLFSLNEKTVYRYIAGGLLKAKNGDMPRVCMIKPRKRKSVEHKIDTKCRVGRSHEDYKAFMAENPGTPVVEMDSVIGRVGGKCLLTLQFVNTGFMLAFLREANDAQSVIDTFNTLWKTAEALQPGLFARLFPVLLTDNGSEFSNPLAIETAPDGTPRTRVFYCDPYASWQKAHVERNHEFVRLIRPKGTNFDTLAQAEINTALSHINSYTRPVLNDKAPFELFNFLYGEALAAALGLRPIPSNDILLKPSLLA